MNFNEEIAEIGSKVNIALDSYITSMQTPQATIYEAMRYSLMAGGKRLRPLLALVVCNMLEGNENDIMPFACAIEMIHTYSLIHDDLPSMDNDDFRRGRPTSHKVFGEAMAILAGDALLNKAYELLLKTVVEEPDSHKQALMAKAAEYISKAAGSEGMIAGQVVDLESEGKEIDIELLEFMHSCKTGALIKAPIMAAALISEASVEELNALEAYAAGIGIAFQIKDDILDVEGSIEELGKSIGKDEASSKSTFVTIYGLSKSKELLEEVTEKAINSLGIFGFRANFLKELATYLVRRKN